MAQKHCSRHIAKIFYPLEENMWSFFRKKILILCVTAAVFVSVFLFYQHQTHKAANRVLLIGLDGASWNFVLPLIQEGRLPNIKKLINSGSSGKLITLDCLTSPVIWTTVATGKPESVHGITGFLIRQPDSEEALLATSQMRKTRAIWNLLGDYHKKSGVVGYMATWPAEKINGVMISDRKFDDSYLSLTFAEPPMADLCTEETFKMFSRSLEDNPNVRRVANHKPENAYFRQDIFNYRAASYLLKNNKYDFFTVYLRGIDIACHDPENYMHPEGAVATEEQMVRYQNMIKEYYCSYDNIIGELLRDIDSNTTIVLISDHGFKRIDPSKESFDGDIRFDDILEAAGLANFYYHSVAVRLEKMDRHSISDSTSIKIIAEMQKNEFDSVREYAITILKNIKTEEDGVLLFPASKDTLLGFRLTINKDYIIRHPRDHCIINGRKYVLSDFIRPDHSCFEHDADSAVIIMSGKNIRRNQRIEGASVYDITPTILYLLGLPLAKDMPGKVLADALEPGVFKKTRLHYISSYETGANKTVSKSAFPVEQEEVLKQRLRSLGYIQ